MGWHDRYTPEYREHERELRKHEPRPGEPDFPIRLEPAPITGALEVAILAQAVPLEQAANLIERYAQCVAAGARLDATAEAIDRCCAEIEKQGGRTDA